MLEKPAPAPSLEPFKRAISLAQKTTRSWGGRFVVVIMPLYAEVIAHEMAEPLRHDRLASMMRDMGIEVIDTVPTFLAAPDPLSLYVMRRNNHPTPAGHQVLAQYVLDQLQARGATGTLASREGQR
jgi:hypothetical protein